MKVTAGTCKDVNESTRNVQESQYTDLQDNFRISRDYTELQPRNDDYNNCDGANHAYVNTNLKA